MADKVRFWIGDEFYQQGEVDKMLGLEYKEGLPKERENIDIEKSFLGFCTSVAAPLFEVIGRIVPPFEPLVAQLRSNIQRWKTRDDPSASSS
jgi:hypothetical protein